MTKQWNLFLFCENDLLILLFVSDIFYIFQHMHTVMHHL